MVVRIAAKITKSHKDAACAGLVRTSRLTVCPQFYFIALAHNLMRLVEFNLEHEEGITDQVSRKKRKRRIQQDVDKAHAAGRKPNPLVTGLLRCTQRGVQFIRWLTSSLSRLTSWRAAVDELRPLMSNLL